MTSFFYLKILQTNTMQLDKKILSDITVHMKYAKFLPEKQRRETWEELVDRNMQMHIRKFPQLKEEIESVYTEFVIPKKVLPSMRSLQFGGKAIEVNNARLFNCFSEDTEFITDSGVFKFSDFAPGDEVKVMTHTKQWKNAIVKKYGEQEVFELTFKKGRSEKKVKATRNHTWLLKDGTRTQNIEIGQGLAQVSWFEDFDYCDSSVEERVMWAYGYVFGDGTLVTDKNGNKSHSMVRLCGKDVRFEERFLELGFKSSQPASIGADKMVYTGTYLKERPDLETTSPELLRAFIRGYLDADGSKNRSKEAVSTFSKLQTSRKEDFKWLESALEVSGFFITGVDDYTGQKTNYGVRPETNRYRGYTAIGESPNSYWYLRDIKSVGVEEVWCLEVEDDKSFVLSGGILTGNCAYLPVDSIYAFSETMFLLLGGSGVGYSVQNHHVDKLPEIRKPNYSRKKRFLVTDDIMGWADAIKALFKSYTGKTSSHLEFDLRDIREKGAALVTAGGKAPGPEPLRVVLTQIEGILRSKKDGEKLSDIECHDILCHIADSVLSGGIRRSAMISLFDVDSNAMINCKSGNWWETNPQRGRANNSAVILRHKITKPAFDKLWERVEASGSGEPGLYFTNDKDWGTNPCVEIGLRPNQFCNLVEINASDIQDQEDFNARCRAGSFIGTLQASYTDFHYLRDVWRKNTEKDALLGVSMTGIASGSVMSLDFAEGTENVKEENERVASIIGVNFAARYTCVKPAGTTSLVVGSSSGIHAWHNDYYVRRLRVNKNEAIYSYLSIFHNDILEDEFFSPDTTAIITIPQKAPDNAITRHESPIDLLERVKTISKNWIQPGHIKGQNSHNVSCTVTVKDGEWKEVGEWMWDNREYYNGLSVLPFDGGSYKQTPFEDCTEEDYNRMSKSLTEVDLSKVVEMSDNTDLKDQAACAGGSCQII